MKGQHVSTDNCKRMGKKNVAETGRFCFKFHAPLLHANSRSVKSRIGELADDECKKNHRKSTLYLYTKPKSQYWQCTNSV